MLKRFFAAFLGSMAAIWVSIALFFVLSFAFFFLIIGSLGSIEPPAGKGSILLINLTGNISDRYAVPTVNDILFNDGETAQSFEAMIAAIDRAANDKKIKALCIQCGGSSLGYALREELLASLRQFKKSGKPVYAYADSYTQSDYYIASVADKIFLNPVGSVDVRGIATQIPFFKGALDKLGVEMQIVKVGSFKSAVEPYILDGPSEPSTLQTRVYIDAIWKNVSSSIADNRNVSVSDVNLWADSIIATLPADKLKSMHVVTNLAYQREFDNALRKLTKTDKDKPVPFITVDEYVNSAAENEFDAIRGHIGTGKHIAILYAVGDIVDEGTEGIVGKQMVPQIVDLAQDDDVQGLILRVNSGGGSAFASEQIWEALEFFKKSGKPFYVSMGDYAASGGYYISCGADKIYADANTLTGSIGIFGMIPCIKGLLNNHLGVNIATISTNPSADMGSILEPMTPAQHSALQRSVDDGYALFTNRVAAGRSLPIDSVLTIAEGRVWDGETALKIGLVDKIGSLQSAIAAMRHKLDKEKMPTVSYPRVNLTPMQEFLIGSTGIDAKTSAKALAPLKMDNLSFETLSPQEARQCLSILKTFSKATPVQARMEPVILH